MIPMVIVAANPEGWRSVLVTAIFVIAGALIIYLFFARRRFSRPVNTYPFRKLAPELAFYSHLVNIELGHEPPKIKVLEGHFHQFLRDKYRIDKREDIFQGVAESEENPRIIELYGEIHKTIESLQQAPPDAVINYTKELKKLINPAVHTETDKNEQDDCNTC